MSLWAQFLEHKGRGMHKWAHYFPIYERHLERYRNQSVVMLEIGVSHGGSLQMWRRYLGPHARIVGIDIVQSCQACEEPPQIAVRIGDQSDEVFLQAVVEEFGPFDVVLDDGSHIPRHQLASFRFLYPKIQRSGVYIVEDLHTNYLKSYEGGYKKPDTFIELCKDMVDELHANWGPKTSPLGLLPITNSMHVYDSVAVFERGIHGGPVSMKLEQPA